jgi:hypothetical protein
LRPKSALRHSSKGHAWESGIDNAGQKEATLHAALVSVFRRVIFGRHHETSSLACPSVDDFDDVRNLLLAVQGPVDLVVVTSPKVDHDVLVSKKKHYGARIVQLVHGVEIRNLDN